MQSNLKIQTNNAIKSFPKSPSKPRPKIVPKLQVTDLSYKNPFYQQIVKNPPKFTSPNRNPNPPTLPNSLQEKSLKALKNHEKSVQDTRERASSTLKYQSKVLEKNKEILESYRLNLESSIHRRQQSLPERLANCINKPGVTSWLRTASGARLRACFSELPLATWRPPLREWEPLTGYMGARKPSSCSPLPESKTYKDTRGYCYKLDPIARNLSYSHAMEYLRLREQGASKRKAMGGSQKFKCNLRENNQIQIEKEEDDHYDDLVSRFDEFVSKNYIKDGEIVKDLALINICRTIENKDKQGMGEGEGEEKEEKEQEEEEEEEEEYKEKFEKQRVRRSELMKSKSVIGAVLKGYREKKERKVKLNKERFENEVLENIKEEGKEFESLHNNKTGVDALRHSFTQIAVPDRHVIVNSNGVTFKIASMKPIRSISTISNDSSKSSKTLKSSRKLSTLAEEKTESENLSEKYKQEIVTRRESDLGEMLDPIVLRNRELMKKSMKIRKQISGNLEKIKEKKQELTQESSEVLKKKIGEKIQKIQAIEEKKLHQKALVQTLSKVEKLRYNNKVQAMKHGKRISLQNEIEHMKKRYEEKISKAESKKQELEEIKAKRAEELRTQYNTHRLFAEMLHSFCIPTNPR